MVCYEIYVGTRKYLSEPVATTSFSTEAELPSLTVCHQLQELKIGSLPPSFPEQNTSELEAEQMFQKALNDNYYLLDIAGS